MLRFVFRGVAAPTLAGITAGSLVQAANAASDFLSTSPVGNAENCQSPEMIASSLAAVAAAGATGYIPRGK